MSRLDPLYHWAPVERRVAILQGGLVPYARPTCHAAEEDGLRLAYGYVCLAVTPSAGWGLSAMADPDMHGECEWDLWQVRLTDKDNVHVLPTWGPELAEVRVRNALPADRVWLVATRLDGLPAVAA